MFQCIPYSVLLQELDIKNVRDLEDLIIEAIYAGKNSCLLKTPAVSEVVVYNNSKIVPQIEP